MMRVSRWDSDDGGLQVGSDDEGLQVGSDDEGLQAGLRWGSPGGSQMMRVFRWGSDDGESPGLWVVKFRWGSPGGLIWWGSPGGAQMMRVSGDTRLPLKNDTLAGPNDERVTAKGTSQAQTPEPDS